MPIKKILKPAFRKVRAATIGDAWMEKIRPIAWYNLPSWIWETVVEDVRFYQSKPRDVSYTRLKRLVSPNLESPVFIVGAPRSGTTFLGECIGTLPEISYHFEPVLTKAATRYVYEGRWSSGFSQKVYRLVYGGLMGLHLDGDLCFAEKTPQISLIIPFLQQAFPNARFIHIIRDGRDVALSLSKKPWYRNDMKNSG
ncbi:MAG: sulfotransferase, partial [Cyanobacteria bacterium J06649_4]